MSLILKYIWVVKTIHRAGRITLKELNEKPFWLLHGESLERYLQHVVRLHCLKNSRQVVLA